MIPFEPLWEGRRGDVEGLARRISRGQGGQPQHDQLVAAGQVALWQCTLRYAEEVGVPFWAYAFPRVQGAMLDELRSMDHVKREARHAIRTGNEDSLDPWSIIHACCLDAATNVPANDNPEANVQAGEIHSLLFRLVGRLPEAERQILVATYFEHVPLRQVGEAMGFSESRACQLRKSAIRRIASFMPYCNNCESSYVDAEVCPTCGGSNPKEETVDESPDVTDEPEQVQAKPGKRGPKGKLVEYQGRKLYLWEWAAVTGIRHNTLYLRIKRGWTVERAMTEPESQRERAEPAEVSVVATQPPQVAQSPIDHPTDSSMQDLRAITDISVATLARARRGEINPDLAKLVETTKRLENFQDKVQDGEVDDVRDRLARLGEIEVEVARLLAEKELLLGSFR